MDSTNHLERILFPERPALLQVLATAYALDRTEGAGGVLNSLWHKVWQKVYIMRLAKRTYGLPPEIVTRFETQEEAGDRSSVAGKHMEEWLAEKARNKLKRQIVEGRKEMAADYLEEDSAWNSATDEVWRRIRAGEESILNTDEHG